MTILMFKTTNKYNLIQPILPPLFLKATFKFTLNLFLVHTVLQTEDSGSLVLYIKFLYKQVLCKIPVPNLLSVFGQRKNGQETPLSK